jgi:hypothetical protein
MLMLHFAAECPPVFVPVKIRNTATILLSADVQTVFPLFGPVREQEWTPEWEPEILYGYSEVEEQMIFRTNARYEGENFYQWIVSAYKPAQHLVEYTVSAPDRVWFIKVECKAHGQKMTLATVTYTYIGLSEEGHKRNRDAMEKMFAHNLEDWEHALNHYLKTGTKIKH